MRTEEQRAFIQEPNASERLSHIGDEIVEQLVEWTKKLPFYNDLPVEVHTHLLTQRWAELVCYKIFFFMINNNYINFRFCYQLVILHLAM